MSIRVNFAGASLLKPGPYSVVQVADGGLASPSLGVVALIGEATAGKPFSAETGLDAVTFGPDEFGAIEAYFQGGELLDAAKLAISPSNDPQISGGAQELILIKTNASTQASATIAASSNTYGTVKAKSWGNDGNNLSIAIKAGTGATMIIEASSLSAGVTETSGEIGGNAVFTLHCTDGVSTAATVTITDTQLTTTITGGTAASLAINLSNFNTITQLVAYINAQPGYAATAPTAAYGNLPIAVLDRVTALTILAAPAQIKKDAYEVQQFFAQSSLLDFTPNATYGFSGLPTVNAKKYLTGGALGGTSGAAILAALDALLKRRVNFVVALFSRDATDDKADNLTDATSSYTINSIHQGLSSHANEASTVKGRKERQAFAAYKGTYADTAEKGSILNSARVQLNFMDVGVLSATSGSVERKQPHMAAVLSAAMKAAAPVGLPNTFKAPQVAAIYHDDFDPETQGDKAIEDNLCYLEKSPGGGFRFVLDNSTYASDTNAWIYNRPSVLYAADTLSYIIRLNVEQFVGRRNSDVSEETIKNVIVGILDAAKSQGLIVADNNTNGKGYKDLKVRIVGSIVNVDMTVALVEGLEFILNTIKVQRAG